ncbi:hypothetical protein [Qipengyuania sphaerica]|uniref:hypothetical protein n=1 Tax=Qipengyuania sphaerica TaxID=2867243 RepID=UPI001C8812FC|nr:hypothetical protein [Qipengyuania sphaerica]MBX7540352.1 hypothetical protein [Qipengyuania sphaerica]
MQFSIRSSMTVIAAALLLLVGTQVFYMTVVSPAGPETVLRPITWMVEMAAFTLIAVAALTLSARSPIAPLAWSAICVGALFNIIQVGMGLSMFAPAAAAQEQVPSLFDTILKGAFFLYFAGKALFAMAAIGFGMVLVTDRGGKKLVGALAILAGLAGTILSIIAMPSGLAWMMPAGIAGTLATALLAVAILCLRSRATDIEN